MSDVAKQFVSSIRLTDANRKAIPAGMPFSKIIMNEITFNKLLAKKYITEVIPGQRPNAPIKVKAGKALAVGLPRETPDAAISPLQNKATVLGGVHTEETANPKRDFAAEAAEKAAEIKKAADKKAKVLRDNNIPENPAQAPGVTTNTAVWTYNPDDLKDIKLFQLLDIYKKRCTEFDIEFTVFQDAPALRAHLSSQFGK